MSPSAMAAGIVAGVTRGGDALVMEVTATGTGVVPALTSEIHKCAFDLILAMVRASGFQG
jgi:hypothetical protein